VVNEFQRTVAVFDNDNDTYFSPWLQLNELSLKDFVTRFISLDKSLTLLLSYHFLPSIRTYDWKRLGFERDALIWYPSKFQRVFSNRECQRYSHFTISQDLSCCCFPQRIYLLCFIMPGFGIDNPHHQPDFIT